MDCPNCAAIIESRRKAKASEKLELTNNTKEISVEEFVKLKNQTEDQIDYQFIQRVIQELTQSCALQMPIPAAAIPPLILQAAQHFWETDDFSVERRWYYLPNSEFQRCGANKLVKLPDQIMSVCGAYKTTDSFGYGALGDFSLERMLMNNSVLASNIGGNFTSPFSNGLGYDLTDVTAALYEIQSFKYLFDVPITYDFNPQSKIFVALGDLRHSNLILCTYQRVKIQDLYRSYYFFRYVICLALRSMATIMGTFEFKLAGGVTINYNVWRDQANQEIEKIDEWINKNHSPNYFLNSVTI